MTELDTLPLAAPVTSVSVESVTLTLVSETFPDAIDCSELWKSSGSVRRIIRRRRITSRPETFFWMIYGGGMAVTMTFSGAQANLN